jgi:hypothetical protein
VINQVKGAFRNGGELDSHWIADKISNSMSQVRYCDMMKIRAHLRDLNVVQELAKAASVFRRHLECLLPV